MKSPKRTRGVLAKRPSTLVVVEALELRRLLSSDMPGCAPRSATPLAATLPTSFTAQPSIRPASATSPAPLSGFTPAQIRHAYQFDQVAGDGTGQTIAIVDAYKHPNIVSDLATFDARFDIAPPPRFTIVGQAGGPVTSLHTNGAWASEVALDVEWAHAIAPQANLLLVETSSDSIPDLMAGVDYARNVAGVSAVALSWGGSEFRGQLKYDPTFSTPANHAGITFVAAAGDVGSSHGPNWPASSPSVVSVGGTSLSLKSADGTYGSETGWKSTTGGASKYERRPAWQSPFITGAATRTSPDVSYDADPNTGFAVYSSVNDEGVVGWSSVAGTSAGVPQWAAAFAISNQLRAQSGLAALDGGTQSLPDLYKLYAPAQTPGFATYTADFNDITQGRTSSSRVHAAVGYDQATGLGTPKAVRLIATLAAPDAAQPSTHVTAPVKSNGKKAAVRPSVDRGSDGNAPPVDSDHGHAGEYSAPLGAATPSPRPRPSRATAGRGGSTPVPTVLSAVQNAASEQPTHVRNLIGQATAPVARDAVGGSDSMPSIHPTLVQPQSAGRGAWAGTVLVEALPLAIRAVEAIVSPSEFVASDEPSGGPGSVSSAVATAVVGSSLGLSVRALLDFDRPEAVPAFGDAMADFAYESTAFGNAVVAAAGSHRRAWAVTFTVLGVDALLIAAWRATRKSPGRPRVSRAADPFQFSPV